jgi:hypothetical protein
MSTLPPVLAHASAPFADRGKPEARAHSPEWLAHWLALLIFFLREPLKAFHLLRSGRAGPAWWHDRPDLPAGSAQAYFASVRGGFGNSIRWMCIRHGIGPGHKDWPEVSRAIVAFGGSLDGFWAGAPPKGLEWWENPGVIPGVVLVPGFSAYAAAPAPPLEQQAVANAPPPAPRAIQAEAAPATLPASWLPASGRHVFARAGPGPSTGPPSCPGLPNAIMSNERGRSMASPAVLIRADRKSRARPGTAYTFRSCDPLTSFRASSDTGHWRRRAIAHARGCDRPVGDCFASLAMTRVARNDRVSRNDRASRNDRVDRNDRVGGSSTRQDHARAGPASGGTNAKFKVAGRKRSVPRHPGTTISPIGPETPTVFRRLPLRNAGPAAPRTNMAPQRTHSRDRR